MFSHCCDDLLAIRGEYVVDMVLGPPVFVKYVRMLIVYFFALVFGNKTAWCHEILATDFVIFIGA